MTSHDCVIVGGGPAGMIAGWLLARVGVDVLVVEKHADFLRDFRGDTIHASTLELMYELGVLDDFLALPHQEHSHLDFVIEGEAIEGPDFRRLPTRCKFLALMPQWDFLRFVEQQARKLPRFHLEMESEVTRLLHDGDKVCGVVARTPARAIAVRAELVIGCDGRHSTVRELAKLELAAASAPIDVLWLRLPRGRDDEPLFGWLRHGHFAALLDRDDYWQIAYVIPKGGFDALRERGLDSFRAELAGTVPMLGDRVGALASWDDVKLLSVVVDRLARWWTPGLLCIGDAAHAMSPIGGIGINLAIQDAIAAANILWRPLRDHEVLPRDLAAVQARREPPTRRTQRLQIAMQDHLVGEVVAGRRPLGLRAFTWGLRHLPAMRRLMARVIGVGFQPERLTAPGWSTVAREHEAHLADRVRPDQHAGAQQGHGVHRP
jgi:2-polyprenyl-6-methoxyphenol hydroxylase-like FAD-dependent oxidoreductase